MTKPTIFISHITEEAEIANRLKAFVERRFLRTVEVFASSNEQSIRLGDEWLKAIKDSISRCELMIVVCSPISVVRPWINFESGSGWVRGVPVIPLCHSGLTPGRLPVPLNSLQAGMLNEKADIQKLFDRIAEIADVDSPQAEDEQFFAQVTAFEADVHANSLLKDSTFIANLLQRQVGLLEYCIYASTQDYEFFNGFDVSKARLNELQFTFNDIHRLFNMSFLSLSPRQKVFHVIQTTVQKIGETIRFILSNSHVEIAPELKEQLYEFLYALPLVDIWYDTILTVDQQPSDANNIRECMVKMIKEEPLPATKKPSNMINAFIDYYTGLMFYKSWLLEYRVVIARLTGSSV